MAAPGPEPDQRIDPLDTFSGERMGQNMMVINQRSSYDLWLFHLYSVIVLCFSRVLVSICAGVSAGVLGLTGLYGVLWMVVWGFVLSGVTFLPPRLNLFVSLDVEFQFSGLSLHDISHVSSLFVHTPKLHSTYFTLLDVHFLLACTPFTVDELCFTGLHRADQQQIRKLFPVGVFFCI